MPFAVSVDDDPRTRAQHIGRKLGLDDLGTVVLTYGRSNAHSDLLGDLQRAGLEDESLVVVHNPDQPDDAWTPTCPERATLIALPRNRGYAAAMNAGINVLMGRGLEAALLLTHEARVDPTTLKVLLDTANEAPGYGVLGLAVRGAGGAPTSYGSYMRADGVVEHISDRPSPDRVVDSVFVDGSALFVRLEACGSSPMPERYFMYFEEAELCSAIRERGWAVGTALDAIASSESGTRHRRGAFRYLYVRNGLDWTHRYQGTRAAARFFAREMRRAWAETPKPGGNRFRDAELRRAGYELGLAGLLGLCHFLARRWGPPPRILLRSSDIRNV